MSKKSRKDLVDHITIVTNPTQCLNDLMEEWTDYLKIVETEKTKRRAIKAWEKATLAGIKAKRDFLISYLERSFDERERNFRSLFRIVDQAIASGDNQQLALALHSITELAKSSPFKELANLSKVRAALDDPDHIWRF